MFNEGISVYIVAGNHDQANKAGTITSLDAFSNTANVYKDYAVVGDMAFIPFRESKAEMVEMFNQAAKDKAKHIFAHAAVNGAFIGDAEYCPKEQLEVSDVKPERFKQVWLGHYHRAQMLAPNMMYCGNPCAMSFEDSDEKGFWGVDTSAKDPVFVTSNSPKFIQLTAKTQSELKTVIKSLNNLDYFKLKIAEGLKYDSFGANVLVEMIPSAKEEAPRIQNIGKLSRNDILCKYVETKSLTVEDLRFGQSILRKAMKSQQQ
jgi:DNA repair exonuclease SbcCD nuclease subunit